MKALPPFLVDLLNNPPTAGAGVHTWLFRVARHLHPHMGPDEVFDTLADKVRLCGRPVPYRELAETVRRAKACAWNGTVNNNNAPAVAVRRWPEVNRERRRAVIEKNEFSLADLWEASPLRMEEDCAEAMVRMLFPGDPLLCCGKSAREFDVKPRSQWANELGSLSFIVPSPMTSTWGRTQEGKPSKHTLSNTGERHYLVCEFDQGTLDEHAALLVELAIYAPLVCVVHSGGKSLHGWFGVKGKAEDKVRRVFSYAVMLGADPATWTRSQFVRMPGGRRDNGNLQAVCYCNPEGLKNV